MLRIQVFTSHAHLLNSEVSWKIFVNVFQFYLVSSIITITLNLKDIAWSIPTEGWLLQKRWDSIHPHNRCSPEIIVMNDMTCYCATLAAAWLLPLINLSSKHFLKGFCEHSGSPCVQISIFRWRVDPVMSDKSCDPDRPQTPSPWQRSNTWTWSSPPLRRSPAHGLGQGRPPELGQHLSNCLLLAFFHIWPLGDEISQHRCWPNFHNSSPDAAEMIDNAQFLAWMNANILWPEEMFIWNFLILSHLEEWWEVRACYQLNVVKPWNKFLAFTSYCHGRG